MSTILNYVKNTQEFFINITVTLYERDTRGIQERPNGLENHFRNQQEKDHVIRACRIKQVPYFHSADNFELRRHHV